MTSQVTQRSYLLILVSSLLVKMSFAGTVFLNGPALQASDLRQIDSYVSSALPIYPKGFQLYNAGTGNRPIIIKMNNNESRKPGSEHPNAGYYTSLPALIPQGFEGVATSTFLLGSPLSFQQPAEHVVQPQALAPLNENTAVARSDIVNEQPQENQQFVEGNRSQPYKTNSVVVETAKFESTLPVELKNPFYSNQETASSLAQESLPTSGELVVDMWDTKKIKDGKVRDLLTGAGLI